jgi:hypothetical protein
MSPFDLEKLVQKFDTDEYYYSRKFPCRRYEEKIQPSYPIQWDFQKGICLGKNFDKEKLHEMDRLDSVSFL